MKHVHVNAWEHNRAHLGKRPWYNLASKTINLIQDQKALESDHLTHTHTKHLTLYGTIVKLKCTITCAGLAHFQNGGNTNKQVCWMIRGFFSRLFAPAVEASWNISVNTTVHTVTAPSSCESDGKTAFRWSRSRVSTALCKSDLPISDRVMRSVDQMLSDIVDTEPPGPTAPWVKKAKLRREKEGINTAISLNRAASQSVVNNAWSPDAFLCLKNTLQYLKDHTTGNTVL